MPVVPDEAAGFAGPDEAAGFAGPDDAAGFAGPEGAAPLGASAAEMPDADSSSAMPGSVSAGPGGDAAPGALESPEEQDRPRQTAALSGRAKRLPPGSEGPAPGGDEPAPGSDEPAAGGQGAAPGYEGPAPEGDEPTGGSQGRVQESEGIARGKRGAASRAEGRRGRAARTGAADAAAGRVAQAAGSGAYQGAGYAGLPGGVAPPVQAPYGNPARGLTFPQAVATPAQAPFTVPSATPGLHGSADNNLGAPLPRQIAASAARELPPEPVNPLAGPRGLPVVAGGLGLLFAALWGVSRIQRGRIRKKVQ
jgi:hypothetical protein